MELWLDGVYHADQDASDVKFAVNRLIAGNHDRANGGFVGCIGTFRFNGIDTPAVDDGSGGVGTNEVTRRKRQDEQVFINVSESNGIRAGCHKVAQCPIGCPSGQVCMDLWKGPFCTCPDGSLVTLKEDGTIGKCNEVAAVSSLGLSQSALILILICLLLLIGKHCGCNQRPLICSL